MKKLARVLLPLLVLGVSFVVTLQPAAAAFNSNNIIDDMTFDNVNTMTAAQIDNWLNSYFPNSCISPNSGFAAIDPIGYNPSQGYIYGDYVTAGKVVADAAAAYGINPQVLLTTLQKEQSLVAGGANYCENGDAHKYAAAVSYGCPDGGTRYNYTGLSLYRRNGTIVSSVGPTCVNAASKAGFSQQVIRAAWLLKFGEQRSKGNTTWAVVKGSWDNSDDPYACYGGPMTTGNYKRCNGDTNTVFYDGYTTIDGTATHMDSGATAALYWYTPHFHGNQSFDDIFNQYFGSQYANDTFSPHPNGTLVSLDGRIYLVNGNSLHYILNASVFVSYGYQWNQVKVGSTGDASLSTGTPITDLAPGTLFRAEGTPVYVMDYEGSVLIKRQVSYSSFSSLGYSWGDVMLVPEGEVPSTTSANILFENQHPSGSLVLDKNQGRIYLINQGARQYISNPLAFTSNHYNWGAVKQATPSDLALSVSSTVIDIAQGTILLGDDGIYLADYDSSGITRRPVGPWECYANRLRYTSSDWYRISNSTLPTRTGNLFTC